MASGIGGMTVPRAEFDRLRETVEVLNGERPGAAQRAAMRRGELASINEWIAGLRKEADDFERTLLELGNTLDAITGSVEELAARNTSLNQEVARLNGAVNTLQASVDEASRRVSQLQDDLDHAQQNVDAIANGQSTLSQEFGAMQAQAGGITVPGQTSSALGAGSPVDAADYNKLVNDVASLRSALVSIINVVKG